MPKRTFFNLPEEKKDKIIAVAIDEFAQNHYEKVTINKIVERAEIPKGSFYQYFENKDDLYIFLFGQIGNSKKITLRDQKRKLTNWILNPTLFYYLKQEVGLKQRISKLQNSRIALLMNARKKSERKY